MDTTFPSANRTPLEHYIDESELVASTSVTAFNSTVQRLRFFGWKQHGPVFLRTTKVDGEQEFCVLMVKYISLEE